MNQGARALGKAYREFRGYSDSVNPNISEKDKVRSSAERLGIDTAGMDQSEIKEAILKELSNE